MRRLAVLLGCMVTGAFAELYKFIDMPMPKILQLTSHYLFHVYTPEVGNARASVTFRNFQVKRSEGRVGMGTYKGLQVSMLPWDNFFTVVNKTSFCSAEGALMLQKGAAGVPIFTVGLQQEASFPVTTTGTYLLTLTNCGGGGASGFDGGTITAGEVIVKQPHGYLPGNKIWTLQWWGWFTLLNAFLCIMWAIAVARHYSALVFVQKSVAGCAVLALLEAAASYVWYIRWNSTGTASGTFEAAVVLFYSLKYVITLRMLLETAAGAGVVMKKLDSHLSLKMDIICVFFIGSQWIWKTIISYKYRFMLDKSFVVAITVPGTLFWLFIFIWVFRKFNVLWSQLQDKKLQAEAVSVFINMRLVLVGSILLATVVLLIQCADIVISATPWNLQWLPYDACPHLVYTLFLLALMILWWPNADSWKLGYTDQVNQDEDEIGGDAEVKAEQIGVAEAEEL